MSTTVRYKGKVRLVVTRPYVEQFIKNMMTDKDKERFDWNDGWMDFIYDRDDFELLEDGLYYVMEKTRLDEDFDIYNMTELDESEYEYEVMYYNGGCSFGEALQESMNRLDSNKE